MEDLETSLKVNQCVVVVVMGHRWGGGVGVGVGKFLPLPGDISGLLKLIKFFITRSIFLSNKAAPDLNTVGTAVGGGLGPFPI